MAGINHVLGNRMAERTSALVFADYFQMQIVPIRAEAVVVGRKIGMSSKVAKAVHSISTCSVNYEVRIMPTCRRLPIDCLELQVPVAYRH